MYGTTTAYFNIMITKLAYFLFLVQPSMGLVVHHCNNGGCAIKRLASRSTAIKRTMETLDDDALLTRRSLGPRAAAFVFAFSKVREARAAEPMKTIGTDASATTATKPVITQRVELNVVVQLSGAETTRKRILVGLYGKEAPRACDIFVALANSALEAPCRTDEHEDESKQRVARNCFDEEDTPVTYTGSSVWRILKDERVDFGQVKGKFAERIAPTWPSSDASTVLKHNRAGLLSVPRGGGTFDFGLTLAPQPALDAASSHAVIGEVLEGFDDLLFLNELPLVKYIGQSSATDASRSKRCFYGSGETFCSQGRPLNKCTLTAAVLP